MLEKKLNNLNQQMDLQQLINHVHSSRIHDIDLWLGHLDVALVGQMQKVPEMTIFASYIMFRILEKRKDITHFYTSVQQDKPDLVTLGEILYNGQFGGLHPESVKLVAANRISPTALRIILRGRVKAAEASIFQVNSFTFVDREVEGLYKYEYVGKQWVMRNTTNDCITAVQIDRKDFVEKLCVTPHFRDKNLQVWKKTALAANETVDSQYFVSWPRVFVYCWGHTIHFPNLNVSSPCPLSPFSVEATESFYTSDGFVNHLGINSTKVDDVLVHEAPAADVHFMDMGDEDFKMWRHLDEAENKRQELIHNYTAKLQEAENWQKNLSESYTAVVIKGHSVDYKQVTDVFTYIFIVIVAYYMYKGASYVVRAARSCSNYMNQATRRELMAHRREHELYGQQLRSLRI